MVNCAHGAESIRGEFCVSFAVMGVCAGLMSASVRMHQKKGFAFAVREGRGELGSRSRSGQGYRPVPGPIGTRSRALRSIAPNVVPECSRSGEVEVSLARKKSRADFREVSLHFRIPPNGDWRRTVVPSARKTS